VRARLIDRLKHAEAEVSALKAARDAALRLTVWGPRQRALGSCGIAQAYRGVAVGPDTASAK